MIKTLKTAFLLTLTFTLFFGGLYPTCIYLIGHLFFPYQAGGSLLFHPNTQSIIGSELIAQGFDSPVYFHPRPSDTGESPYNGTNSGGSELGPSMKALIDANVTRADQYRQTNCLTPDTCVPVDAVTASSSGLDPHISISNALLQAPRVAMARNMPEEDVHALIQQFTERPSFGLFGEARVNVLMLNLRLDNAVVEKER
ncbi:MAG: potassium-transporting ATPase subunit KdpC [Verrucomicrobia bacterium]|nr:potassium-transporting ATPase subunit KdpC [Verrucomicrobiota bacterium]